MKFMHKRLTFMHKTLWIDVETSGLDPNNCALLQIGVLIEEHAEIVDRFVTYIQPFKGAKVEPEALKINKIKAKDFSSFPLETAVIKDLMAFLNKHVDDNDPSTKLNIAGFNVGFDIGFLKAFFERHKKTDMFFRYFHKYSYDVASDVAKARMLQRMDPDQSMSLKALCREYNVNIKNAHDAQADILATRELSHKLTETINDVTDAYSKEPDNIEKKAMKNSNRLDKMWKEMHDWSVL